MVLNIVFRFNQSITTLAQIKDSAIIVGQTLQLHFLQERAIWNRPRDGGPQAPGLF